MSMLKEFKTFALRGNVVDMAVGIIIGAAFGKVVSSFVTNVVMPPLGLMIGGVDFADLAIILKEAQGELPAVTRHTGRDHHRSLAMSGSMSVPGDKGLVLNQWS